MIKTVEGVQREFTKREIEHAEEARRLYVIVGRPSQKSFEEILTSGKLMNNMVTIQDYKNALEMFGTNLGALKGKTTRSKPDHIPVSISDKPQPKNIVLSIDILFFTGLSFLIMVSRNIRFITAMLLPNRKKLTIFKAIRQVFRIYQGRGHKVGELEFMDKDIPIHTILADNDFRALQEDIEELGVDVHVVSKEEHVPEVEHQNRVIKERARAIVQTLPYKRIPKKIRIALIHYVVFWLNNMPKEGQVNTPRDMIMGTQILDCKNLCKLPFGAYVQTHDDISITNTMEPRTAGGINLGPSNLHGGHKFFNLTTGEVVVRRKWMELPVPSEVILRLKELSSDPNDEVEEILLNDEEEYGEEKELEETILDHDETDQTAVKEQRLHQPDAADQSIDNVTQEQEINHDVGEENIVHEETPVPILEHELERVETEDLNTSTSDQTITTSNTSGRYNLRPNRTPNYLRRFAFLSVQAGIKKWGDKAREAVQDELRMFTKERVFKGLRKPTAAQMRKALMIHCFVVEKRDGRIKARAVADGRGQTRYSEEETYSPTVQLESIMLNAFIDAFEGRHVATVDIKGGFLCEKALYGHIEAARYDPCVYNKCTKEGVVTIRTYVDDLKISSTSKKQLDYTIEQLRQVYGEITVHLGPEHDYLGVILTYHPEQKKITLNMSKYTEGCIEEFENYDETQVLKIVTTPATDNLYRIRKEDETSLLSTERKNIFHSTVAKLLFLAKRGCPHS